MILWSLCLLVPPPVLFSTDGSVSKPWYLVNIKIAGKWMFIPLKMVLIGIDPYPDMKQLPNHSTWPILHHLPVAAVLLALWPAVMSSCAVSPRSSHWGTPSRPSTMGCKLSVHSRMVSILLWVTAEKAWPVRLKMRYPQIMVLHRFPHWMCISWGITLVLGRTHIVLYYCNPMKSYYICRNNWWKIKNIRMIQNG